MTTNDSTHHTISYADSGVSIDRANAAKERIKTLAAATFNARTLTEIGSFGGMFDAAFPDMTQPTLVASADGVGTKLKIAFLTKTHHTVGRDLVNHCVNDILVQGARPLFFLDYIATGKLEPDTIAAIVEGVARGCRENDCVLLGGETAEMPGFYREGEYDIAGFIIGIVDRPKIIDGSRTKAGDIVLGLPSSGLHTNGYSLARKLLFDVAGYTPDTHLDELGTTVGAALLAEHKSYLPALRDILEHEHTHALAHITGGGIIENIPRVLPRNLSVELERASWETPALFNLLQRLGNVAEDEMLRTFNCGIGMVVICAAEAHDSITHHLAQRGETARLIGRVVEGNRNVRVV
ncbi:MAG: phosphoribosylformylglycinamidine cyclo-ligase [Pyrinomonadaceae bacterium MAG19_C2-C3]|nr:phosphoribosylformylglycinamidine cyclo-ligase [Pyrinomonadaceae bacterium MAG19_C2-C3]